MRPPHTRHPRALALALVSLTVGCAAPARGAAPPRIDALEPASGPAGEAYPLRVTVRGGPFLAEGNLVRFGPVVVGPVTSPDGATLSFDVPKLRAAPGEAPPMVLPPGTYEVTVEVGGVVSEPAPFVLTAGGAP